MIVLRRPFVAMKWSLFLTWHSEKETCFTLLRHCISKSFYIDRVIILYISMGIFFNKSFRFGNTFGLVVQSVFYGYTFNMFFRNIFRLERKSQQVNLTKPVSRETNYVIFYDLSWYVVIEYCFGKYLHVINDEHNYMTKHVLRFSKMAANIHVWSYIVNFNEIKRMSNKMIVDI